MSQSLSQLWTHIIFSTKKRYPFLKEPAIQQRMHDYLGAICLQQQCKPMIVGGVADHVHLLISLHKNIALSVLVEKIKKSSSKWIKTIATPNDNLSQFYWQSGYGAFSVSQSNVEAVRSYIANQSTHHQKQSFQDELRKFLKQHTIAYNEEYLWE